MRKSFLSKIQRQSPQALQRAIILCEEIFVLSKTCGQLHIYILRPFFKLVNPLYPFQEILCPL